MSLAIWANAWLAGRAAPDDVVDALSAWAPRQDVNAVDEPAADRTGLSCSGGLGTGAMTLLQTVRAVAGPAGPSISLVLPVPGDVRGLPAGTEFHRDVLDCGEAVVIRSPHGDTIGLMPSIAEDDSDSIGLQDLSWSALSWTVYALPSVPMADHTSLGEAEFEMRAAIRSAAETLAGVQLTVGDEDPRAMVEEILHATSHHRIPDHAPARAVRVLSTAAHVDAIITVSSELTPIGLHSAAQAHRADGAVRPLTSVVRAARLAAVSAIVQSAWEV